MKLKEEMKKIAESAKEAGYALGSVETDLKNRALKEMAKNLLSSRSSIMRANRKDLESARRKRMSAAMIDRLALNDKRISSMAEGFYEVARLEDPVGTIEDFTRRPNGLLIGKIRVPIGVVCIIYESRPNVTADCVALCLKAGNATILRGGREAINSNLAIYRALEVAAGKMKLPRGTIGMVKTTDRKAVDVLLGMTGKIDVVIPRGGESLIREVTNKAKVPVIKHYKGVCHVYVDEYADLNMAESIAYNAKVQRPGVCNAMETLLVHEDVAARFLPSMARALENAGVEIRGCPKTMKILRNFSIVKAKEVDWHAEYLDLILSVKVVSSLIEATEHINKYGTNHSDAIVTEDEKRGKEFIRKVNSGAVYVNASTRFTDGQQFGKGAEIGISTDKLHARGPMGLEELTTYKYIIFGNGQIRT